MTEEFNPKTLFDNIDFLIKNQNRKIGEVENEAGVSAGYISRTSKDGGSRPGIDFIMKIAHVLHVSIDTLLKVDISSLTPTERYLISFLEKLEQDTTHDLLDWDRLTAESLNNMDTDQNGNTNHPLFEFRSFSVPGETGYPEEVSRVLFPSHSFGIHTEIHGDCFELRMKNGAYLHLMDVSDYRNTSNDPDSFAKEIWMSMPGQAPQYLCSDYEHSKLVDFIDNLYAAVVENTKHPKVKQEFRYIIDSFMKDDNEDDPPKFTEEIPF
mgnify:CR=1 FL=1|jgi:transcriptional regulator with XRE-family HTH domain